MTSKARSCPEILTLLLACSGAAAAPDPAVFDAGSENRLGLTFSPDGNTAFWVEWNGAWGSDQTSQRIIYMSRQRDGKWSKPEPAPFTGKLSDDDPFVSPDGQWLYFVSDRPRDSGDADADIWRYSLEGNASLEHLSINSGTAEYSPVVTESGALYFASARDGGPGQGDIYRAVPNGGGFAEPEPLGYAINSETGEWNLWVSPDEADLIFEASSRPTNVSIAGDLYYSWRTESGWTAALPVSALNSNGSDLMPRLHPDGETLYYTTAPFGGNARISQGSWPDLQENLRASYAPVLLTANRSSHEVTFVDLARGAVTARVPTGDGPHLLSNAVDGRVVATGYGEFPRPHDEPVDARPPFVQSLNSRLTVIDISSQSVTLDTTIDDCSKPHASWLVDDLALVTCEDERSIVAVEIDTGRTFGRFDTQQDGSHVLGFSASAGTLVVSNTDSGSVSLIDVESGDTRILPLAAGSEGSVVIDDRAWVGNGINGSVSVVDIGQASEVARVESVCNFPISLGAGKSVWVACFGSAELVAIDPESFAIERRIRLHSRPLHLLLHPDRELAYVSLPRKNAIAEIDLVSGRELRRIRVGIEPDGLRWSR